MANIVANLVSLPGLYHRWTSDKLVLSQFDPTMDPQALDGREDAEPMDAAEALRNQLLANHMTLGSGALVAGASKPRAARQKGPPAGQGGAAATSPLVVNEGAGPTGGLGGGPAETPVETPAETPEAAPAVPGAGTGAARRGSFGRPSHEEMFGERLVGISAENVDVLSSILKQPDVISCKRHHDCVLFFLFFVSPAFYPQRYGLTVTRKPFDPVLKPGDEFCLWVLYLLGRINTADIKVARDIFRKQNPPNAFFLFVHHFDGYRFCFDSATHQCGVLHSADRSYL